MRRDGRGWFIRQPIAHGTYCGFRQHERHGVPDTPECGCRKAYNAYKRSRNRAWRANQPPPPREPQPSQALQRAIDERWFVTCLPAGQAAQRLGVTKRTIQRYRALLREEDARNSTEGTGPEAVSRPHLVGAASG